MAGDRFPPSGKSVGRYLPCGLERLGVRRVVPDAHAAATTRSRSHAGPVILPFEEGLAALSEEWIGRAPLLHLRGELLAREDGPAAEASFREAIALARRQGARMYELRATTSLARWLTEGGRVTEARRLLAPLYASFTEGFDTRDLMEARALLEELS